jgi:hypothetical protein
MAVDADGWPMAWGNFLGNTTDVDAFSRSVARRRDRFLLGQGTDNLNAEV